MFNFSSVTDGPASRVSYSSSPSYTHSFINIILGRNCNGSVNLQEATDTIYHYHSGLYKNNQQQTEEGRHSRAYTTESPRNP